LGPETGTNVGTVSRNIGLPCLRVLGVSFIIIIIVFVCYLSYALIRTLRILFYCCLTAFPRSPSPQLKAFIISWDELSWSLLISPVPPVISHRVRVVSTLRSSLHLWPPTFCLRHKQMTVSQPPDSTDLITVGVGYGIIRQ
jgi:hypothetical protein